MEDIVHLDKELFIIISRCLGSSEFDSFWIYVTKPLVWIPLYLLLLFLLYKKYFLKDFLFILLFIALGITASDQIANIFKYGFQRLRPCHDPELINRMRLVTCGGKYGFYSAHASTTFFLATFLSFLIGKNYKFLPYLLFMWAMVVSYSRIYLGVHFPGDVAVGALMGFLLGGLFTTLALGYVIKSN